MVAEALDIGYAIQLPPRRAIQYFRQKGHAINWNWWETWQAAHAKSFTVAKAMRQDILETIRAEQGKAIAEGLTARQFAERLEPRLKNLGWWGRQTVLDPKGNLQEIQLGSPHRLRTIYDTNMRTSRAVAHYQVQQATVADRPYWMYDAMDDLHTRPQHAAMDNLVFAHDDPIWRTHYPPNGFKCRCRVRALSREEVDAKGLSVSSSDGLLHQIKQQVGVDKSTGEIIHRPATEYRQGDIIMAPDPGWNYNPGAAGGHFDPSTAPAINEVLPPIGGQRTWHELALPTALPLAIARVTRLPKGDIRQFYAATESPDFEPYDITRPDGVKDRVYNRVVTPEGLEDVFLGDNFARHIVEHSLGHRERFANYVLPTLQQPGEVWGHWTQGEDGSVVIRQRYLARFDDANTLLVVQEMPKIGALAWTFFPIRESRRLNRYRVGDLLYRGK